MKIIHNFPRKESKGLPLLAKNQLDCFKQVGFYLCYHLQQYFLPVIFLFSFFVLAIQIL